MPVQTSRLALLPALLLALAPATARAATQAPLRAALDPQPATAPADAGGRYVVGLAPARAARALHSLRADRAVTLRAALDPLHAAVVDVPAAGAGATLERLRAQPGVAYVEPDAVLRVDHASCAGNAACAIPDDPLFSRQWYLQNDAATLAPAFGGAPAILPGADVDAPLGWAQTTGSPAVKIAIIDTGIDANHPDLTGKVAAHVLLGSGDQTDHVGHGTFIAGLVGAGWNDATGIAGVDPSATLLDVKDTTDGILDGETATASALASAIVWATDNGAQVINVSQGNAYYSAVVDQAVTYAWNHNALVIASAGNDGTQTPSYPAADADAIAVGALDDADQRASFSQYGAWVQLAAPGQGILSTLPLTPSNFSRTPTTPYGWGDGTSFSAPIVAAVAGMIWPRTSDANANGFTNDDVARRLFATSDRVAGTGTQWAYGRVNLCQALAGAGVQVCATTATVPPPLLPAPAASPGVQAPLTPTPGPTAPRVLPVRPGAYTGNIRTTTHAIHLVVAPNGISVTHVTAAFVMRCARGRTWKVTLNALRPGYAHALSSDGSLSLIAAGSDRNLTHLRFHVSGRFTSTGGAYGVTSAWGISRRFGRCRTGQLSWRVPEPPLRTARVASVRRPAAARR